MTSNVSSRDHFAKVRKVRLVRKIFYFGNFWDIYVKEENKKSQSTRDL